MGTAERMSEWGKDSSTKNTPREGYADPRYCFGAKHYSHPMLLRHASTKKTLCSYATPGTRNAMCGTDVKGTVVPGARSRTG